MSFHFIGFTPELWSELTQNSLLCPYFLIKHMLTPRVCRYATSITIGTQTFEVIVDTGSSDTWVVETGFECINFDTGKKTTESECDFGPYYTIDSTFVKTADENFDIEYGDGEYLSGIIGTETVTLAGIEVTDQTIALVTSAAWEGDGTTSGLTGLAYTAL
jgi:hypothetical protein